MCGIVGYINKDKDKKELIKKMADRIAHRGPDDENYYTDLDIALGHRRLSIIDLSDGIQPMFNEDESIVVIFNGEIYNYKELKTELEEQGHKFKTECDTEVLVHGYEVWRNDLPNHLRGMFAFAIWDKREKSLFCARDYFGIKPFYYYENDGTFMFASEIKCFLEHPKFEKVLNKELLEPFLTFSFTPTEETFFKGVKKLNGGSSLFYKDGKIEINKYFEPDYEEKDLPYEETVDKIDRVMKDSVEYHMTSDVEVGSFLSSGIDSSYIVSLSKPDKTYTVGYDDYKQSEIEYAEDLTSKLGIVNKSKKISKEEYMANVPKIMYHMDEPISDPAAISLYFLSELASEDLKVILSGEGADEFFGGYNSYREIIDMGFYNKIPYPIRHIISCILELLPEFRGRNFLVRRGKKLEDVYISINRLFSDKECKRILSFKPEIKNSDITNPIYEKFKGKSDLIKMQAIDANFWLANDILHKADRMSMANSLEVRVPFVDREVFKLASSLTQDKKVTKENTKVALRDAAKKVIPNEAYKKKKLGFPVPLYDWYQDDTVYNEIKNTIEQDFVGEFFDQKYAIDLFDKARSGVKVNCKKVWALYAFIKWYEVFFLEREIKA